MHAFSKATVAFAAVLVLGGCGGGGGGGGGGGSSISGSMHGIVVPRTSVVNGTFANSVTTGGSFSASTPDGSSLNASGSWNSGEKSGTTYNYSGPGTGPGTAFPIQNAGHTGSLLFMTGSDDLASLTVLATTTDTGDGSGAVGAFYYGSPRNQSSRNDVATYDGGTYGRRYDTTGETSNTFSGDATITADFSSGGVNGSFDSLSGGVENFSFTNARMYSNDSRYQSINGQTSYSYNGAGVTSGHVEGAFFRSNGSETSGVYMIDSGGDRIVGGYTAIDQ